MSDRVKLILLDIAMVAGIVLVLWAGVSIYNSENGLSGRGDHQQDLYRQPVFSSEKFSLEIPHLQVEEKIIDDLERKSVEVEIPVGTTVWEVASIFEEKGLISTGDFLWLVSELELERRIKAGSYEFQSDIEINEIFDRVLIPE